MCVCVWVCVCVQTHSTHKRAQSNAMGMSYNLCVSHKSYIHYNIFMQCITLKHYIKSVCCIKVYWQILRQGNLSFAII